MVQIGYTSPILIHPGETLKDELDYLGISQEELARRTGLSEKLISQIVNEKASISPETALKLERVIGISAEGLLNMQSRFDYDLQRVKEDDKLKEEVRYLSNFPCYKELVKLDFVKDTKKRVERVRELLKFLSVDSLLFLPKASPVAFRQSSNGKICVESVACWLRVGEIEGNKIETNDFDIKKLRELLPEMRKLAYESDKDFSEKLKDLCSKCGIALVYTPHFSKTNVNGVSRWISPNKALIQLTLRSSYADIFWFSFFHEIAHILKHSRKETFIDYEGGIQTSEMEKEADEFAQKTLIPSNSEFTKLRDSISPLNQSSLISKYSERWEIDKGIIAGRLARETGDWKSFARYRTKLSFAHS